MDDSLGAEQILTSSPSVKQMIYIAVLCNPKITAEPLYHTPCSLDPMPAATLRRISMKALARYQVILLGERKKQRELRK